MLQHSQDPFSFKSFLLEHLAGNLKYYLVPQEKEAIQLMSHMAEAADAIHKAWTGMQLKKCSDYVAAVDAAKDAINNLEDQQVPLMATKYTLPHLALMINVHWHAHDLREARCSSYSTLRIHSILSSCMSHRSSMSQAKCVCSKVVSAHAAACPDAAPRHQLSNWHKHQHEDLRSSISRQQRLGHEDLEDARWEIPSRDDSGRISGPG